MTLSVSERKKRIGAMPQTCSVCKSKQRSGIEAELIRRAALRGHYGTIRSAWHRHKTHVFWKLALVKRHEETLSAENLLAEMADLKARLWRGVEQAERAQSPAAFVAFAREFRQCVESCFEISQRIAGKLLQARANTGLAEAIASRSTET